MVIGDGNRGSVDYLAVSPDHQRCGFGQKMMEACEAWFIALGIRKIELIVRTDNDSVDAFSSRLGYIGGEFLF